MKICATLNELIVYIILTQWRIKKLNTLKTHPAVPVASLRREKLNETRDAHWSRGWVIIAWFYFFTTSHLFVLLSIFAGEEQLKVYNLLTILQLYVLKDSTFVCCLKHQMLSDSREVLKHNLRQYIIFAHDPIIWMRLKDTRNRHLFSQAPLWSPI